MTDAEQWLADLEAKAKAATPGPWANTDNVLDMFGREPLDWWHVYAKVPDFSMSCIPIMQMHSHMATDDEMCQAREDHFRKGLPMHDPGQAGKNARFIAAANPATVLRLVGMVRWLALNCTCPPRVASLACTKPSCTACRLAGAYAATEERHD